MTITKSDKPVDLFITKEREKQLGKDSPASRAFGGSYSDKFNMALANATVRTFFAPNEAWGEDAKNTAIQAVHGIGPENELEGMIAAQMVAAHAAAMECYRRAAIPDQHQDARHANINLASKASRTFAALNETLLRARGKTGSQDIHVHQHHHHHNTDSRTQVAAENAVVNIKQSGGGAEDNRPAQPHEQEALTNAETKTLSFGADMWSYEPERETVPGSGDEIQKAVPPARRKKPRRSKGQGKR